MGTGPKRRCFVILLVFLCFLIRHRSSAEKVLLVPLPTANSHWMALAKIGRALVDKGHIVTVVVSEDIVEKRRTDWPDFQFEAFQDKGTHTRLQDMQDQAFSSAKVLSLYKFIEVIDGYSEESKQYCSVLLGDRNLLDRLKTSQCSVVISDSFFPCGAILSAHLDIRVPHIAVTLVELYLLDEKATGVPLPLSYVPSIATDFTDDMTFVQRLQNIVLSTLDSTISPWVAGRLYDELVHKYIGEEETIQSVTSRTDLWLYCRTDNVLDYPRPTMPNMVQVGGLNVRRPHPLSEDMEAFVQSSGDDGVIVVSFGSMVKTMSTERREVFAAAFARLRQKVVWRYLGEKPTGLGNNTKLLAWLPQNDLIAHPKTRAFITHAGSNGLYEALHHGVPMVCLPLFGDQPANAARVVARGLGVKLDFSTVTAEQLYQAILHVVTNNRYCMILHTICEVNAGKHSLYSIIRFISFSTFYVLFRSYRETAIRLSRLHRDQPQSPMERAVWWIEHVIKHGRLPHLRARAVELPWYQYYLLDVAVFLFGVCSAVLGTVWYSCSFFCRTICCKSGAKLKSQ
ncbi:UDP-glucuronosyltransferase 2C1-like [Branchiostoma lanceolatum]|uniref:UDP-glucuronosyltransferase 2C1-like n=1 Tax=Branchiostoma lanceolatum TaxID=7740 RepID=UPI003452E96D